MERHEIRPAAWRLLLLVLGLCAFVALGVWLLSAGGLFTIPIGILTIVFFGGFGSYALYRMSLGQGRIAVTRSGLEIALYGPSPRVIPWSDIDEIGVLKIANQEFTTIRLNRYASLVDGLTDEEARAIVRRFQALKLMGYATVAVGAIHLQDVSDLAQLLNGSRHVTSVVDTLQHARRAFGAEILLPWNMRDRRARAFADYLKSCRAQSIPPVTPPQHLTS